MFVSLCFFYIDVHITECVFVRVYVSFSMSVVHDSVWYKIRFLQSKWCVLYTYCFILCHDVKNVLWSMNQKYHMMKNILIESYDDGKMIVVKVRDFLMQEASSKSSKLVCLSVRFFYKFVKYMFVTSSCIYSHQLSLRVKLNFVFRNFFYTRLDSFSPELSYLFNIFSLTFQLKKCVCSKRLI